MGEINATKETLKFMGVRPDKNGNIHVNILTGTGKPPKGMEDLVWTKFTDRLFSAQIPFNRLQQLWEASDVGKIEYVK